MENAITTAEDILARVEGGAFVSYAQNYEDVMLWRALGGQQKGFYIDVGAFHAIDNSVTKAFYDNGWSGINIDPNPSLISTFDDERPRDKNLAIAVSDASCEAEIFLSANRGWSTMNKELADAYAAKGTSLESSTIKTLTLDEVFAKAQGTTVDFLKVDVEGHENEVIKGNDWSKNRPRVVLVETVVPAILQPTITDESTKAWSAWEDLLQKSAYTFAYFDGLNTFYVRDEDKSLLDAFSRPPNYFDNFVRAREVELATALIQSTN